MAEFMCFMPCFIFLIEFESERPLFLVVMTLTCSALAFLFAVVTRLRCLRVRSPDLLLWEFVVCNGVSRCFLL